ncbi:HAD-IA family hydrolase [Candidatus Marinimicrobia bacterium]|nr:HAD-IA family hydrolase [Candidatus Neomarinimicrobiota bacterium]
MIKAILFDLDGVLVDARELHYEALNRALDKYDARISRDEHLSTYDGLPTTKKLELLTENKGLSKDVYDTVWEDKQFQTQKIIDEEFGPDQRMIEILSNLKKDGLKICVCSNSIRETTRLMLLRRGFKKFMDFFISNQDVKNPKPNPEMFLKAMVKYGVSPKECVIVEDSHYGRQAAFDAGAHLCAVENTEDVTYEKIKSVIDAASSHNKKNDYIPKWQGGDLRVVIPLAGSGNSYQKAGHNFPKFLVDIAGKPMIQWVIENINVEGKFIFIFQKSDYEKYNLKYMIQLLVKDFEILLVDEETDGAARTVLKAEHLINDQFPLAIINGDQYMKWNSNEFFYAMAADECDGGIVTFKSTHPQYSFVKTGEDGFLEECSEKKPISDDATAGVYYFREGKSFVRAAKQMISKKIKTDNQYFVCPTYNELIAEGKKIRKFDIEKIWSFSVPEGLEYFIRELDDL